MENKDKIICGDSLTENDMFQHIDGGANPTSPLHLWFRRIVRSDSANRVFIKNHYLHRKVPISVAFGAYKKDQMQTLVGAMSFGKPASPSLCQGCCGKKNSNRVFELNRLWMSEECPPNSESRFIGWVIRILKNKYPNWILCSYADTAQKHIGTIYQATGWTYTGLSDERKCGDYDDGNGKHSRHAEKTNSPNIPRSRKHRYFYFLNRDDIKLLKYPVLPYPKLSKGIIK